MRKHNVILANKLGRKQIYIGFSLNNSSSIDL